MNIPVSVQSSRPLFLNVDLRGLANLYASLSANEQAQFFELVAEELKVTCGDRDWLQIDNIAIELGNVPKALEFVRYISTAEDTVPA